MSGTYTTAQVATLAHIRPCYVGRWARDHGITPTTRQPYTWPAASVDAVLTATPPPAYIHAMALLAMARRSRIGAL